MVVLPPGTLLQLMYLDERLRKIAPGKFIEIGPGGGEITNRLLTAGWSGSVYDLSETTTNRLKQRFANEIGSGRLTVVLGNFLEAPLPSQQEDRVDMIISCMVMEHMDDDLEKKFMTFSGTQIKPGGKMVGLVPASPHHWGIEDEIAGHFRRYNKDSLESLFSVTGWKEYHLAGLTYPLSNLLLPLSNFLVKRKEADKLDLSKHERTKQSGHRNVRFKTHFPAFLKLFINEKVLLPFHWVQKTFSSSERALVIYFEASTEARLRSDEEY